MKLYIWKCNTNVLYIVYARKCAFRSLVRFLKVNPRCTRKTFFDCSISEGEPSQIAEQKLEIVIFWVFIF